MWDFVCFQTGLVYHFKAVHRHSTLVECSGIMSSKLLTKQTDTMSPRKKKQENTYGNHGFAAFNLRKNGVLLLCFPRKTVSRSAPWRITRLSGALRTQRAGGLLFVGTVGLAVGVYRLVWC